MKISRRGLLGFFGVGATIAPIIGAVADEEHTARIIEPPRVELIGPPKLVRSAIAPVGLLTKEPMDITLIIRRKGHSPFRIDTEASFGAHTYRAEPIGNFTTWDGTFKVAGVPKVHE